MAPDFWQDQLAQLQGRLQAATDRVQAKQAEVQALQAEKQQVQQQIADLKAAYLAWKGTPP